MRYLRKFNEELNPDTYLSAAEKLKKLGFRHRSKELTSYGNNKIKKLVNDRVGEYRKKFGKFGKLSLYIPDLHIGKKDWNFDTTIPFDFIIQFDVERTSEYFDTHLEIQDRTELELFFWLGIIPTQELIDYIFDELDPLKPYEENIMYEMRNGFFWINTFSIKFNVGIEKFELESIKLEEYEYGEVAFLDRLSSNKFKNTLRDIFTGKIVYPNTYTSDSTKDIIDNSLIDMEILTEYNIESEDIGKMINDYSVNKIGWVA
jgi:hypothetical protein